MKISKVRYIAVLLAIILVLPLFGCKQNEQPVKTNEELQNEQQEGLQQETHKPMLSVSQSLVGFIVPNIRDVGLCTVQHGFLRTAETMGYPAKLYYAAEGAAAVEAVDEAKLEGCVGLIIWSQNDRNAQAVARAAQVGLPVVVPYYSASGEGLSANVVADLQGYVEEVALSVAERMVERECKAGKILVYGRSPVQTYEGFVSAIETYYPQYNVAYFERTATDQQSAIDELAQYILWNRDIKGLFCTDADGSLIAVKAREQAIKLFKSGAPEDNAQNAENSLAAAPGPTPIPSGLIKSIVISVAGYGLNEDTIALMRDNDIYAMVIEPYYEAGAQSLMLLDRILNGETVPEVSKLNMPIVRLTTLDKYVQIDQQVRAWFELN
ncbi:substrate-binding domain-containing protein [Eubacteriales bacterium OttesenSCG-928-K08]|nr:substrate-binding domain-containing protein [Eubacteriales bacterium OttesenSCG-928-K08]